MFFGGNEVLKKSLAYLGSHFEQLESEMKTQFINLLLLHRKYNKIFIQLHNSFTCNKVYLHIIKIVAVLLLANNSRTVV